MSFAKWRPICLGLNVLSKGLLNQLVMVKCDEPDKVDMDRGMMAINMCVTAKSVVIAISEFQKCGHP